jgi:hypothetical protein
MEEYGLSGIIFDVEFARQTIANTADAVREAIENASVATHIGLGKAKVEKVASNRRILGEDGKVKVTRFTACGDPKVRAEPEGIIDPMVSSISFWNEDTPIVVMTYYATHPQSYYRTGMAHCDFPGMARHIREATHNGLPHIHFNGAGGDIGAGKYNDGSHENRQTLALRLAEGMAKALESSEKNPVTAADVSWEMLPVVLPASEHLDEEALQKAIEDESLDDKERIFSAKDLIWLRRCESGDPVDLSCLTIGDARILHMPGELSVEYQLAAQKMREDLFVAMAAYGDYATGYICMEAHYAQGGYEASPAASSVSPAVEGVLMTAMADLLDKP